MLCCDWFKHTTIPQSFATAKNRSRSPTKVRHIGWQLADVREYLLTSVASTVSRRIYIYIRGYDDQLSACHTVKRFVAYDIMLERLLRSRDSSPAILMTYDLAASTVV